MPRPMPPARQWHNHRLLAIAQSPVRYPKTTPQTFRGPAGALGTPLADGVRTSSLHMAGDPSYMKGRLSYGGGSGLYERQAFIRSDRPAMLKAPPAPAGPHEAGRAGVYRRQPSGYRAFIPAPLPPDPPVRIDGALQALLSRADLALGRVAGSIETLPNPDLFVLMYVRKEAVLSSQIEGTQSSLTDVLAAEAKVFDPAQPHDVAEVLNYAGGAARRHGELRARPDGNLSRTAASVFHACRAPR